MDKKDIVIIAHFITDFAKGGTSRFVYIAEELSRRHQVEIITSSFDHTKKQQRPAQEFELETKITILSEPSYPRNVCLQRYISHAHFGKQVAKYLKGRKKPDVIYCAVPSLDCAYAAARYAKDNGVRFIVDVQDLWPEAFKMAINIPVVTDVLFYPMQKKADFVYSCADVIAGVSETYCLRAKRANGKNALCVPVFLGTELERFDENVEQNRILRNDGSFVIAYCGTLGLSYDIKCVLDAMAELKSKGNTSLKFWIMGDGPQKEELERYAEKLGVDAIFHGRVPYPQMCGLLCACDVCVNPIIGTSAASIINKHGDYAASGLPVINTQSSDEYRKLVEDYACGINCEPSNVREVAEAIEFLASNPEKRKEMGAQARKLAHEKFDRKEAYKPIFDAVCR